MGTKKLPENAPPQKPDPLAVGITDFAWWLKDSVFDISDREWTEEDVIKYEAQRVLGALNSRRAGNGNANNQKIQ